MKQHIPLEPIVYYLFDILKSSYSKSTSPTREFLHRLFQLSAKERISYYIASWLLEQRSEDDPTDIRGKLKDYLQVNRTRNLLLRSHIVKLAQLFNDAEIPLLFLKGAAGLIRDIYPLECRYVSDIDALVDLHCEEKIRHLLYSAGYVPVCKRSSFQKHHHIEPYSHSQWMGWIEIHTEPYELVASKPPVMPHIWDDAERLSFHNELVAVPSITDYTWILMRTDLINKILLPRLSDTIEMFLIMKKGYSLNFDLLAMRAKQENIPNIVQGMSYACSRYMGMDPFAVVDDSVFKKWEAWSFSQRRKAANKRIIYLLLRNYCASIRYLPSRGLVPKIKFIWQIIYNNPLKIIQLLISPGLGIRRRLRKIHMVFQRISF